MRKNLLLLTLLAYLMCSPILTGEEEKPAKEQKKGEQSKVGRNRTEERPQTFGQRLESMSEEEQQKFRERMRERFEKRRIQERMRSTEEDEYGLTPLHYAVVLGDEELIKSLLKEGVSVDSRDNTGRTPLHYAAGAKANRHRVSKGNVEVVRLLLENGADIDIADKYGWTPLHYSLRLGEDMTNLLIGRGADVNLVNQRGVKPLPDKARTIYYVAPVGNDLGFGNIQHPFRTISTAIVAAHPGHPGATILLRGGIYRFSHTIRISKSGKPRGRISLRAYPGEKVVLDFSRVGYNGILLEGAFWHIKGLAIKDAGYNGIVLATENSHHNVLEQLTVFDNRWTGIALHNGASHNLVLNCDAYHNFDPRNNGEDADGIEVKFSIGEGNVLIGNRAWSNSDDGYDFWDSGRAVRLEDCYAWRNGENVWNHPFFTGNGNGFKLARGDGRHVVIGCVAWGHKLGGFNLNGNSSGVILYNCTAMGNRVNFQFRGGSADCILANNMSHKEFNAVQSGIAEKANSWDKLQGWNITNEDFLSLDETMAVGPRNPDGSIPENGFLKLSPKSKAIDK
ncbi:MAG: ankyrin repeat domain-containing protein, partial [Planctomycetota bacterium]